MAEAKVGPMGLQYTCAISYKGTIWMISGSPYMKDIEVTAYNVPTTNRFKEERAHTS